MQWNEHTPHTSAQQHLLVFHKQTPRGRCRNPYFDRVVGSSTGPTRRTGSTFLAQCLLHAATGTPPPSPRLRTICTMGCTQSKSKGLVVDEVSLEARAARWHHVLSFYWKNYRICRVYDANSLLDRRVSAKTTVRRICHGMPRLNESYNQGNGFA